MKIGLLIGLGLVAVLMIYIGTRPSLSPRAKLLRQNNLPVEPRQETAVNTVAAEEITNVPQPQPPQQVRFKQFIPQPLPDENTGLMHQETQHARTSPQPPAQEINQITVQEIPETGYQTKRFYIVRQGDTLSKISKIYYGSASDWNRIYQANRSVLDSPDKIRTGMKLIIPKQE
ncbi:MAG: LysM peptidoglycan-binding domain-containing protein [Phycisphaerae bacterium]